MSYLRNFYCSACNRLTLGEIMDIQTTKGISQSIKCTNCGIVVSLEHLSSINEKMMDETIAGNIDSKTGFVIGSQEYNDHYYPIIDKKGMHR